MTRYEIRAELDLPIEKLGELEYHSFVNLLNVLTGELQILAPAPQAAEEISGVFTELNRVRDLFTRDEPTDAVMAAATAARNWIRGMLERHQLSPHDPAARYRIMRLLDVADLRVREMLARTRCPDCWARVEEFVIRHSLEMVFEVMAEVSERSFRVAFGEPTGAPDPGTYYVSLTVLSPHEGTVLLPNGLQDSLRDLAANARKYSDPGTVIRCRVEQTDTELTVVVSDSGRGIPPAEIDRVVDYGYRASNARDDETMGGGFGLTRAYALTKRHGGRMWIASQTDPAGAAAGTSVELRIPLPNRR